MKNNQKILLTLLILALSVTACSQNKTTNDTEATNDIVTETQTEAVTEVKDVPTEEITEIETTTEALTEEVTESSTEEVTETTTEMTIDPADELPPIDDTEGKWIYNPKVSGLSLCNERMRTEFNQESFNNAIFDSLIDIDEYKKAICIEAKIIFIEPEDPFIYVVQLSFENHEDTKVYMRAFWNGRFSCINPDELDHDPEEWTP